MLTNTLPYVPTLLLLRGVQHQVSKYLVSSELIDHLWSISLTFYVHSFHTKVLRAAFFHLHVTREKLLTRLLGPFKKYVLK